jgi:hypothetical protein
VYSQLATEHPIDLTRYQVANCYLGRAGLINSGGASGENDLHDTVRTAIINKRAGGTGADFRPQGVPETDSRGRGTAPRDPGRLPGARDHGDVSD